jgi:hypothetical protein
MKKFLSLVSLLIILLPNISVLAAPVPDQAPADSTWHCVTAVGGDCPDDGNPLEFIGSISGLISETPPYALLQGKMVCEEVGCSTDVPVFINVSYHWSWTAVDLGGHPWMDGFPRVGIEIEGGNGTGGVFTYECGSGDEYSGECTGNFFVKIDSLSADPAHAYHAMAWIQGYGPVGGSTVDFSWDITMSGQPTVCDSQYQVENCLAMGTIIDPTKEAPADVLTFTLEQGKTYRMKLAGAWQAEAEGPDLTDVEISFDGGTTWNTPQELMGMDLVECVQEDPDSPDLIMYFTAPSTSMKIRVKDDPGEYADNTGGMTIDLCAATIKGESANCAGQFTVGTTVVATGLLPAHVEFWPVMDNTGSNNPNWLEPGQWYVLTTSGGPWLNDGEPPDRYDIQMSSTTTNGITPSGWQTPDDYSMSNCQITGGNYISVYFQGSVSHKLWLRVNDTDNVWIDNTGSMSYTITTVDAYEPYATGCALPFDVGNFIEARDVYSTNNGGVELLQTSDFQWPVWPFGGQEIPKMARYFVLETTGYWTNAGTFTLGGYSDNDDHFEVTGDMKKVPADWSSIPEWPEAYCVQTIDPIGHQRVFFDASKMGTWKFRVHDPDTFIGNNSGTLGYRLYYGINLQVPQDPGELPGTGFCTTYYTHGASGVTITLYGNVSEGIPLPLIAPEVAVGIEVVGGPWKNNDVDSYATAISDDNGATYTELTSYGGVVCKEQTTDANHPLVYVLGKAGKEYRVRVHDPGGNFDDNSLSIQMTVYAATISTIVDPWQSCANNYNLTEVPLTDDQRMVGGALVDGKQVAGINPGKTYALEITGEGTGWGIGSIIGSDPVIGEGYYSAVVSNGSAWEFMPEAAWITCAVKLTNDDDPQKNRFRIYFTSAAATNYRIKVNSVVPTIGKIYYRLYTTTDSTIAIPPGIYIPPGNISDWGGCNKVCSRPGGIFSITSVTIGSIATIPLPVPIVGDWVDYVRCATFVYLSWCQQHTAMLTSMIANMENREPFGMMIEVQDAYETVKQDVENSATGGESANDFAPQSYIFQGGGTGGQGSGFPGLFPKLPTDSPWITGQFDLTTPLETGGVGGNEATKEAYVNYCNNVFISRLGLSAWGLCAVLGLARYSIGNTFWVMIQFAADVSLLLGFIFYIKRSWIDTGAAG